MIELDIVERLRGKVRVPVNDGAGLLDGKDFFERTFPTSRAALEAADEIERLRHALKTARSQLITLGGDREWGSGDQIHAAVLDLIDTVLSPPLAEGEASELRDDR